MPYIEIVKIDTQKVIHKLFVEEDKLQGMLASDVYKDYYIRVVGEENFD